MQLDAIIPIVDAIDQSTLNCSCETLYKLGVSNIILATSLEDVGVPGLTTVTASTIGAAVTEAAASCTADMVAIQHPQLMYGGDVALAYAKSKPVFDIYYPLAKVLILNGEASNRVRAGQRRVRRHEGKLDSSLARAALLIRRSMIDVQGAVTINELFQSLSSKSLRVLRGQLTGLMINNRVCTKPVPAAVKASVRVDVNGAVIAVLRTTFDYARLSGIKDAVCKRYGSAVSVIGLAGPELLKKAPSNLVDILRENKVKVFEPWDALSAFAAVNTDGFEVVAFVEEPEDVCHLPLPFFITGGILLTHAQIANTSQYRQGWLSRAFIYRGDYDHVWQLYNCNSHAVETFKHREAKFANQDVVAMHIVLALLLKGQKPLPLPSTLTRHVINTEPVLQLVTCWFPTTDKARLRAARAGATHLAEMCTGPSLLVEATTDGRTQIPEWKGERLLVPMYEDNLDLWQKEVMLNMGCRHVLASRPEVDSFLLPDLDVYPLRKGWEEATVKALRTYDVLQPWSQVRESNDSASFKSWAYSKLKPNGRPNGNHGFACAMTASWFRLSGGFLETGAAGGGDTLTMTAWSSTGIDPVTKPYLAMLLTTLINEYQGPRTVIGFVDFDLVHEYHGDRHGAGDTRKYVIRHVPWRLAGGMAAVIEKDSRNGLWKWQDHAMARALRANKPDILRCHSVEDAEASFLARVREEDACPRFIDRSEFDAAAKQSPDYWEDYRWDYVKTAIDMAGGTPVPHLTAGVLEVGPWNLRLARPSVVMDIEDFGIGAVIADAAKPWPFRSRLFSVVLALQVLEHLGDGGQRVFFTEAAKRTLDKVIVSVPWQWHGAEASHNGISDDTLSTWTNGALPYLKKQVGSRMVLAYNPLDLRKALGIYQ